jgi:hypothetical protein
MLPPARTIKEHIMRKLLPAILSVLALAAVAYPQGLNNNEVEFTGTMVTALDNGDGQGTLFVSIDTVDLRVIVNSSTLISGSGGASLTMAQLAGLLTPTSEVSIEVTGKFSSSGILANQVRVIDDGEPDSFKIHGHITGITDSTISLLGITLGVTGDTKIESDGAVVPMSSLTIGTAVQAVGSISTGGTWTAETITIVQKGKKKGNLKFEGVVVSYTSGTGLLEVAVNGATGNVTNVYVTDQTVVRGDLVTGAYVMVIGVMSDLTVTAKEVRVIGPLEIKPDERKLKVDEKATFTIKLEETAAADVTVKLSVDPGDVVTLSGDSVLVPKGAETADFTVTAVKIGTATIKAEALGGSATALVKVGEVSEDENERPAGETRIAFAPDHIKLNPGDTREVVLLIQPPPETSVELSFLSKNDLVTAVADRTLGKGVASMKVSIQSGKDTGSDIISVELGSAKAELLVEVASKGKK